MALKPQSRNLIRKNINNFTATDFKENSRIGGILKSDLHTYTFLVFIYGLLNNLIREHFLLNLPIIRRTEKPPPLNSSYIAG